MKSLFLLLSACVLFGLPLSAAEVDSQKASRKIDQLIQAKLKENDLKLNPAASDEVMVRRLYLDIIGRIPTPEEATLYLKSKDPDKNAKLIDELIGSEGYVSHYFNYFADLLRVKSRIAVGGQSIGAGMAYERWIKDALRTNRPYDEMVYDLVTAHGSSWDNPATAYYLRDFGMPLDNLAMTTQVFLGKQIVCAQCHDHPFDQTTQMDYYHLAAFTFPLVTRNSHPEAGKIAQATKILAKQSGKKFPERGDLRRADSEILFDVRFNNVFLHDERPLRLPHDYQYDDAKPRDVVEPRTILGPDAVISENTSLPEAFGKWLTSKDNPNFAKVISNRLWKEAFGLGVIEPIDDLKEGITGPNPELMAYLEKLMIDLDFDLQAYLTIVFNTKAYQREATLEEHTPGAPYYFQGPILRRMSAEQIWDSIVALAVENPDQTNRAREIDGNMRLTTLELIGETVYRRPPRAYVNDTLNVVKIMKGLTSEIEAATAKVVEAQEAGDEEAIRVARQEAQDLRNKLSNRVEEVVYRKGLEKQVEFASLKEGSDDEFFQEISDLILQEGTRSFDEGMNAILGSDAMERTGIIRPIVQALYKDEREALQEEREEQRAREMKEWNIPEKGPEFRTYVRTWRPLANRLFRASEMASPAPPGHFLGEFGQSDRQLIENANDDASITQALELLNGSALSAIGNRYSVLGRSLKGKNTRERLDSIYLAMLSREPTAAEISIFGEAWEANPDAGSTTGIIWTILNTRQFLFIQ